MYFSGSTQKLSLKIAVTGKGFKVDTFEMQAAEAITVSAPRITSIMLWHIYTQCGSHDSLSLAAQDRVFRSTEQGGWLVLKHVSSSYLFQENWNKLCSVTTKF